MNTCEMEGKRSRIGQRKRSSFNTVLIVASFDSKGIPEQEQSFSVVLSGLG